MARRAGDCSLTNIFTPDLQELRSAQRSIGSRLWHAAQTALIQDHPSLGRSIFSGDAGSLSSIEHHETLDLSEHCDVAEEEYSSESSMMELEYPSYLSEDELLSIGESSRESSPDEISRERAEEMLCT